jgi:hypothetical protein
MFSRFASITQPVGNAIAGALWKDPDIVEPEDLGGYGEPPLSNWAAIAMLVGIGGVLAVAAISIWLSHRKGKGKSGKDGSQGPGGVGPADSGQGKPPAKNAERTSAGKLMSIAEGMGADLGVGDALVLKSSRNEAIRVEGKDAEGMTPFNAKGLPNEEDAVPVLYHWLRDTLRRSANLDFKTLSTQFVGLVKQAGAPGAIPEEDVPDTLSASVNLEDLLGRVAFQIKYGTGMFNVEAMTAHLGAYWESVLARGGKGSEVAGKIVSDIQKAFSLETRGAERTIIFHHDLVAAHSNAARAVSGLLASDLKVVQRLHQVVLGELSYRDASCATDGNERDEGLNSSRKYLDLCGTFFFNTSSSTGHSDMNAIWQYTEGLKGIVDEGIKFGGIAGFIKPVGTRVNGYAPTSASIVKGKAQGMPRINHLTRFRAFGK